MKWTHYTDTHHDFHELEFEGVVYRIGCIGPLRWRVSTNAGYSARCGSLTAAKTHVYRLIIKSVKAGCPECGGPLERCEIGSLAFRIREVAYGLYCKKCDDVVTHIVTYVKRPMLAEIALYQALRTMT